MSINLVSDRLILFDLETGGFNPLTHPVIQWAGIATDGNFREIEAFEVKVQFDLAAADPEALAGNNYDAEVWAREAVPERDALDRIARFVGRYRTVHKTSKAGKPYTVAAYNARFDGEFTAAWFKRAGLFFPGACFEALDPLGLARWASLFHLSPPKNHQLSTVAEWLGIPPFEAHDALTDVRAMLAIVQVLTDRFSIGKGGA